MRRMIQLFLCIFGLWITPLTACDLCGCYMVHDEQLPKAGFFFGAYEQYTQFGTLQVDGRKVPNEVGQYMDSSITQFLMGYQFGDRVAVQLSLPYVNRSYRRPVGDGIETGTVSGLGDSSLLVRYRMIGRVTEDSTIMWNIQGGLKMPTGNSDRILEELHESEGPVPSGVHGHDLTLGSGSWDGLIGTTFYANRGRIFGEVTVQSSLRSKGRIDYKFANDILWSAKPGVYFLQSHVRSASLSLAVSGEAKGKDTFLGEKAEDTGMTSVFMGPEASFAWRRNLNASFGADFPVMQHNTSFQSVPDHRFRAALVWHF
ncbi:MAG TPA: hypothetical protein VMG30_15635 [Acidobacteriota bacterium]|nr:hypothetical protein [Acidobacteriota bacterium]